MHAPPTIARARACDGASTGDSNVLFGWHRYVRIICTYDYKSMEILGTVGRETWHWPHSAPQAGNR